MSRSSNNPLNPHDLLYTNQFIQKNIITNREIENNIKNNHNYRRFVKKQENNTKKYLQTNLLQSDPINLNKMNKQPWPKFKNNSNKPILSNVVKDMSEDRYRKTLKTLISINSDDRDIATSTIPNNYNIELDKEYKNVEKIVLKDFFIPNSIPPINEDNNSFIWQYPNIDLLKETGSCSTLIPAKNNIINILDLPGVNFPDVPEDQLIYSKIIGSGYFNTEELEIYFREKLSYHFHGIRNRDDPCFIDISDCGICLTTGICNPNPSICNNSTNLIDTERKYQEGPFIDIKDPSGNSYRSMNFTMNINPNNHIVNIINRIEEIPILAVQTIYEINLDPFTNSMVSPLEIYSMYIIFKIDDPKLVNYLTKEINPYPLIINNINTLAGISYNLINFTPFFDAKIYSPPLFVGGKPDYVSTYEYIDTIDIEDFSGNLIENVYRFKLNLSSGNINDNFFTPNGKLFTIQSGQIIFYNESFENWMNNGKKINGGISFNNKEINEISNQKYPLIGRGLPFRLIKSTKYLEKKYSGFNGKSRTILDALSWPNNFDNETLNTISLNAPFKFVHSNIDDLIINSFTQIRTNDVPEIIDYKSPQKKLPIENYNGKYYLKSIPFIFLKIIIQDNSQIIDKQLIRARNLGINEEDLSYEKKFYEKFDREHTSDNIYYKNTEFLFAKIYLEQVPFKTKIIYNVNREYVFYDSPLNSLSSIKVIITDPNGEILNLGTEHSFTLEIIHNINVLKDTLIDSRRGDIVTTGIRNIFN